MKINIKKILLATLLPAFVLVLSGCGNKPADVQKPAQPAQVETKDTTAPGAPGATGQQTSPATAGDTLPALPSDNTQAIDSEIQSIDQEVKSADDSLANDSTDADLGL